MPTPPENQNKQPSRKHSLLKTGALVNIVAGVTLALFLLLWPVIASSLNSNSDAGGATAGEITVNVTVEDNPSETIALLYFISLYIIPPVITALSIVILLSRLSKRPLQGICYAQLALAVVNMLISMLWSLGACCVAWIFLWAMILQLIGSIQCLRGIWKLDD